jgi:thimet oligopeptidase
MNHRLFFTAAALALFAVACSEPSSPDAASETAAVQEPGPALLIDGPDATKDLAALNADCEADFAKTQELIARIEAYDGTFTIETVLKPLNELSMQLDNALSWPYLMGVVHPEADYRDAADACVQQFIPLYSDIGLSKAIYTQIKGLDISGADAAIDFLVTEYIRGYERSGVNRDEDTRERIKTLNDEIFAIQQLFDKNIRDDVRYVELTSVEQLAGLPEDYIAGHPADADGIIRISTSYPDMFPLFSYAHDDNVRYEMRMASGNRGYPVNEDVLRNLLKKRKELAGILGYETFAHLSMEDRMIGTPERAKSFIDEINALVRDSAYQEKANYLERYKLIDPDAEQVMPWQRGYVEEILRGEKYDFDSKDVREYFQFENVRDGIFKLTEDLFGVTIRPWETSVWHESVSTHEMVEDGKLIGRFYLDLHPRDGKDQHASHYRLRTGVVGHQIPLSALVTNFPGGDGSAGLMQHSQVETFLHEFGHLIHNMFSGTQEWADISGMSMERDFVEAPSQMLEEWVWDYEALSAFAKNTDGEVLPVELFEKMRAARNFGRATLTAGQTYLAAMSLEFHTSDPETLDFDAASSDIYERYSVYAPVPGTHGWANFGHLGGYSSNYYTYQWSLAIAADLFTRFEQEGLRDGPTARAYRDKILASAGARPADAMLEDFLGRPFSVKAYADDLARAAKTASTEAATE